MTQELILMFFAGLACGLMLGTALESVKFWDIVHAIFEWAMNKADAIRKKM